ncbi:DUF1819 family protein [Paeniglutamicibacter gangotriensis]|uniref:DUF1819 family protein n=1 Tax=Paeniglutamicibacter gangotriensis TaxID=254787 RepID=UPI0037CAF02A
MEEPNEATSRYKLSFTNGGLLVREAEILASLYLQNRDWQVVRNTALERNVLQARAESSNKRVLREILPRLAVLNDVELEFLVEASPTERRQLMWVAACRRYELLGEFAEEVVRERFLLMTPGLNTDDFDRFIAGKTLWHPELEELKDSTRTKLRRNALLMLQQAELLSEQGDIIPVMLSERIIDLFYAGEQSDVRFLPTSLPADRNLR